MSQKSSEKGGYSWKGSNSQSKPKRGMQSNLKSCLQDPTYGQFEFDQHPITHKYSDPQQPSRQKEFKDASLPVNQFLGGQDMVVQVYPDPKTNEEVVVVIRSSIKSFQYYSDDFYRDKKSKKSNQVNEEVQVPVQKDLMKFFKKRYYLFSKYDRGIKIDDEGWYSVTPETIAKHIANKVKEALAPKSPLVVLDAFCGVGGNLIQFARKCGYCVGNDFDQVKVEYTEHNAGIYMVADKIEVINKDYLELCQSDFSLSARESIDAVFLSPPWGGTGYNQLQEYSLKHLYPDFSQMVAKSVEFSNNLILFLPKNTSVDELVRGLLPFKERLNRHAGQEKRKNELVFEIEQIYYGKSCKALLVSTGEMCKVEVKDFCNYFVATFCNKFDQGDDNYLRALLSNIFLLCGYTPFIKYFKKEGKAKISLQKVIKKIQATFSEEEWAYLKKYHKKSRTNSRLSSTMSNVSMEEEKQTKAISDTSSITSGGRKSNRSGSFRASKNRFQKRKPSGCDQDDFQHDEEMEAIAEDYFERDETNDDNEGKAGSRKVNFVQEQGKTLIELKDLSEKDFVELIEGKNSDKRFYGWLHFDPWVGEHHKTNPLEDMEYFRLLYDNDLFNQEKEIIPDLENMKDQEDL